MIAAAIPVFFILISFLVSNATNKKWDLLSNLPVSDMSARPMKVFVTALNRRQYPGSNIIGQAVPAAFLVMLGGPGGRLWRKLPKYAVCAHKGAVSFGSTP